MFFSADSSLDALNSFIKEAELCAPVAAKIKDRLDKSVLIAKYIRKDPDLWSEKCTFNIDWVGPSFIIELANFNSGSWNQDAINSIYTTCYRFLCEYELFLGNEHELYRDLKLIKTQIQDDALKLDSDVSSQIIYASYEMPADLIKSFIRDKGIDNFSKFNEKVDESVKLKEKWDVELEERQDSLEAIKEKLEEYKTEYNFVGLHKGFSDLATKKTKELKFIFLSLIGMSFLIIFPLAFEFFTFSLFNKGEELKIIDLFRLIPLISMELILVYFFRIILMNYRSTKTQIMQLELRLTLCQFIQNYADYASDIKTKDSSSLEKFENLIFSGILSDTEKLPSTFDGLEQISSMLKNLKG